MQYDVSNPTEYIELLENDWRKEKLLVLRQFIINYGTGLSEEIPPVEGAHALNRFKR